MVSKTGIKTTSQVDAEKQASQYARSLIEASVDPLVTISPDGKITDVNEASIRATGASRDELIGSVFSDYFTEPEKAEQGYQTVLKRGSVSDYALTIKHKNGKLMDVLYNASVYKDAKGNVLGVFAAARDVTKSKQASQYARSLIEASLDPLVTISPEGKITDVNEASIRATGASRDELIGSDFSLYFTDPAKAKAGYQEVFKKGIVRDYLLTIRSNSGKLTPVLYNASVYKDKTGKVLGVFAAAREIGRSELKAAQARELQRVSKQKLFKVVVGRKLSKGDIRLSDKDAKKINLDIVDNVSVKPTRNEIGNRKISALSMTSSKVVQGTVVLSAQDFLSLGLEEDDTVFLVKGAGDTEVEFGEDEYETPKKFDNNVKETQKTEEKTIEKNESFTENKASEKEAEESVGESIPVEAEESVEESIPVEEAPLEKTNQKDKIKENLKKKKMKNLKNKKVMKVKK